MKNNDESKKQTIGSKRKGREYKVEDDDDNEAKVKRKRNQKNNKRIIVDESSSEFEVTTTSSKGPLTFMILLYLYCTKFDDFDVIHQIMAIKHWKSIQMKHREKLEIEKYGRFGMLPKKEALNLQSEDYIKMIKEKCYNIHQDLISVREKLDEGLSRFPDSKKLNMFCEKFEETTTGIDNDDTTGMDKESYSPDCQMESDSPASDDDNQKSNFQVLFHKESGNSDLQRMKNKDRNEDVDHILNEDDKVDYSCPAAGFCFVIEGDEIILSEVEDVEKEKKQIGNEDDRVVEDSHTTIPDYVTEGKGVKFIEKDNVLVDDVPKEKYSLNECDVVIQDENKAIVQDSVKRSEHTLEKEKKKISNEELRSESLKGNVGTEDAVDSQETIEDIFKQDEQIQSAEG
nr:ulp1 protease family, C-terminal catalytic domain-containing protein [Tanacetum cinerariifolium]